MGAWLTPDDPPGELVCKIVMLPNSLHAHAAFRGAFLLLCDPNHWESFGTQTPETMAAAFYEAFSETLANWEVDCADYTPPP